MSMRTLRQDRWQAASLLLQWEQERQRLPTAVQKELSQAIQLMAIYLKEVQHPILPIVLPIIRYKATFEGSGHNHGSNNGDYALFGYVNGGTLRNMSVSGEVLLTANGANDMNVALLCGHSTNATIDHCNVAGSVSTYVNAQNGGGADAALLIGQADNTEIKYCSGSGNVVGVG